MKRKELNVFKYSSSTRRKKNSYTYIQTSDFTYKIYVDYLGIPRYFIKYKKKKKQRSYIKIPSLFFYYNFFKLLQTHMQHFIEYSEFLKTSLIDRTKVIETFLC